MKLNIEHKTCFSYQSLVRQSTQYPVSYTHLTLPTSDLV